MPILVDEPIFVVGTRGSLVLHQRVVLARNLSDVWNHLTAGHGSWLGWWMACEVAGRWQRRLTKIGS